MIIAIKPTQDVIDSIAVEGGLKPDTLHITVVHMESEDFEQGIRVMEILSELKRKVNRFFVTLPATSRFNNVRKMTDEEGNLKDATEPTDVITYKVHSTELSSARSIILDMLDEAGIEYSKTFAEYIPHISIAYVPSGTNLTSNDYYTPDAPLKFPLVFEVENIELWMKDGRKYTFPLS